jgi:putative ABC transport system permease protein
MNTQIILAGLRARPVRTGVGVLAVVLEVVLILLLVGMANGSLADTANRVAGVGGEIIVKNADSSFLLGASPATLPFKIGNEISQMDGVVAVAPVVAQMETGGGLTMIWGIDPQTFGTMSGGFKLLDGKMFSSGDEAVVDDRIAADRKLHVGGPLKVLNHDFKVAGIVQSGTTGARVLIPVETAGEMVGRTGWATFFYIKLNDKALTKGVIDKIKHQYSDEEGKPKYDVIDADEWFSMMYASNATTLGIVFKGIEFLGVCIGVLVIFLSMYTTVTERTREIGILRAMGASRSFIVVMVMQESVLLCLVGAVLGVAASYFLTVPLKGMWPTLNILITPDWIVQASVLALISGVIGSLYPAYKAASQDPIEALAYE